MEIKFNPSGVSKPETSQPTMRSRGAEPVAGDAASFSASDTLKTRLSNISTVRPDEVARAQSLVSDGKYPPDDVLDRIAILLAIHHLNDNSSSQTGQSGQ